jgi:hypothetical protein
MARILINLSDGALQVFICVGDTALMVTEEEWYEAQQRVENFMRPVFDQREALSRTADTARYHAEMAKWQRIETICGREFRIQQHPYVEPHHDTTAWLAIYSRDDAPFLVQVDDVGSKRPWTIEGGLEKHYSGRSARTSLRNNRGGLIRFATIAAAVKKAFQLETDKAPPTDLTETA